MSTNRLTDPLCPEHLALAKQAKALARTDRDVEWITELSEHLRSCTHYVGGVGWCLFAADEARMRRIVRRESTDWVLPILQALGVTFKPGAKLYRAKLGKAYTAWADRNHKRRSKRVGRNQLYDAMARGGIEERRDPLGYYFVGLTLPAVACTVADSRNRP